MPVVAVIASVITPVLPPFPLASVIAGFASVASFFTGSVLGVITSAVDDGLQDVTVGMNRAGKHAEGEKK